MDKKEIIKLIIRKLSFLKKGGEFAVAKEIVGLDEKIFKIDYKISKIAETVDEEINKIYSDLESKLEKTNYEKIDREEIAKEVMKEVLNNIEIPEPKKGEDGKDYILTEKDKKEIATKIKVPIVEKIIEHTEVIKEQPIITNEIKEVAKYQTGEQIVDKININTKQIKREKVEGFDDLERIVRESNAKLYTGISETRALELIKKNPIIETPLKAGENITITNDSTGAKVISSTASAISITTAEYKTLINTYGFISFQWYLITDFTNKTLVAGTANTITTGAVEQIYIQASSQSTIYPTGYSKTYPDEQITFKQDPMSIFVTDTGYLDTGTSGGIPFTILDIDKLQFETNIIPTDTTDFYFNYYNNNTGSYIELFLADKDTLWFWDEINFVMTIPQVYDFDSNLIDSDFELDTYIELSVTTVFFDFSYLAIVGRKNAVNTVDISADYRSQLCRRYKPDVPAWSAGSYNQSDVVSYGGVIWGALTSTSSTPGGSAVNWVALMADDYLLSATVSLNGLVSFYVPIDIADYQDLPILDTAQLDTIDYPINISIKNLYQYDYVDVVISNLSGWRNATVVADKVTLTGQVSDGKMTLTNCVLVGSTFSDIYLTNSLVRGALNTVNIANGSSLVSGQQLYSCNYDILSGVTFRLGASNASAKTLTNMVYHLTVSVSDWGAGSNVRYSGTCSDNYFFNIYNCTFTTNAIGAKHYGTTRYTNFRGQWLRNKSFGDIYGTSEADRQTFGYTADCLFVGNTALNYFSQGTNIINSKFLGSFSNMFTSATPSDPTTRIDNVTFLDTISFITTPNPLIISNKTIGIASELALGLLVQDTKAMLDLASTTKGVLMPRMTTTQKNAITSPPEGLEVYDLTTHKKCVYDGSSWQDCY